MIGSWRPSYNRQVTQKSLQRETKAILLAWGASGRAGLPCALLTHSDSDLPDIEGEIPRISTFSYLHKDWQQSGDLLEARTLRASKLQIEARLAWLSEISDEL